MMRREEDKDRWSALWPACERRAAGVAKWQRQKVGLRSLFSAAEMHRRVLA
jgi:anti-sigma factor RsiW